MIGLALAVASFVGAPVFVYLALLFAFGSVNAIHAPPAHASVTAPIMRWRASLERISANIAIGPRIPHGNVPYAICSNVESNE